MQDSVFTKIIKGEIPCHKVYEDDKTIAFLTIGPYIEGHKKVAARIKDVYDVRKAVTVIMGYEVPHAHVHIMPATSEDEYFRAIEERHSIPAEPDHAKLAAVAERLRF
jgi:histidine triad (HIT) family protein